MENVSSSSWRELAEAICLHRLGNIDVAETFEAPAPSNIDDAAESPRHSHARTSYATSQPGNSILYAFTQSLSPSEHLRNKKHRRRDQSNYSHPAQ